MQSRIKKIIIIIITIVTIILSTMPVFAATHITSELSEPIPSMNTAYLMIGAGSTLKLFMISSTVTLDSLFLNVTFDGSKWQLQSGSLREDGLATDIHITRFNGITGVYETRWTVDTATIRVTTLWTSQNYTNYVTYGIPVQNTGNINLMTVDYQGTEYTEIQLIRGIQENINTLVYDIDNVVGVLEDITNDILTSTNAIQSKIDTTNSRINTTNSRLNTISNYLQAQIPIIENKLDTLIENTQTIIFRLDTCIQQLQIANNWLEKIYNILNNENATTIPNQDTSVLDDYQQRENELMPDKSQDINNVLSGSSNIMDTRAIASINNLLQNTVFSIPEIVGLITFVMAVGLVVLIIGRKVKG